MDFLGETLHASSTIHGRPTSCESSGMGTVIPTLVPAAPPGQSSPSFQQDVAITHHISNVFDSHNVYFPPSVSLASSSVHTSVYDHYNHSNLDRQYAESNSSADCGSSNSSQYDSVTNGMRGMHFTDHVPSEVIHHYPTIYLPDGLDYGHGGHPAHAAITGEALPPTTTPSPFSSSSGLHQPPPVVVPETNTFFPLVYQTIATEESVGQSVNKAIKRKMSFTSDTIEEPKMENEQDDDDDMPPCAVCGDLSTGVHYGCWACEGCKGFFRRAMLRRPEEPSFSCLFRNSTNLKNCDITRENRNRCRACRLRRCIEVGMNIGVKEVQLHQSHKKRRNINSVSGRSSTPPEMQKLTACIVAAQNQTFTPVSHVFTNRYAAVLSLASDQLWPPGGDLSKRGFQSVQHFAHSLPFVSPLSPDLRTRLLESNAIDIMILRVVCRFCPERDSFLFPPGAEVTLACLSSTLLGSSVTNRLASLGRTVTRLEVSSVEMAFLSTLILLSSEFVGDEFLPIQDFGQVRDIEVQVLRAFQSYMHQRWPSRPVLIGKLLAIIYDVRALRNSVPVQAWLEPSLPCS